MPNSRYTRRRFLATAGMALLGAACTRGGPGSNKTTIPPAPGSLEEFERGTAGLTVAASVDRDNPMNPGRGRVSFALITLDGGAIAGGSPQVYVAKDKTSKAMGPFAATWFPFTAYKETGDHSPESQLPGTYAADVDAPPDGLWTMLAVIDTGTSKAAGEQLFAVTSKPLVAAIGSKAVSVSTPVATSTSKLEQICTRTPPDHMHAISLADALKNGKPTVVSFATPLLCESMLCGPVVDEQILAFEKYGSRANFIHVEEFLPGPDHSPGPATLENQSEGFKAWGFQSEPWVLVIDAKGVIRARMGPGPTTAPEIESALTKVL